MKSASNIPKTLQVKELIILFIFDKEFVKAFPSLYGQIGMFKMLFNGPVNKKGIYRIKVIMQLFFKDLSVTVVKMISFFNLHFIFFIHYKLLENSNN